MTWLVVAALLIVGTFGWAVATPIRSVRRAPRTSRYRDDWEDGRRAS